MKRSINRFFAILMSVLMVLQCVPSTMLAALAVTDSSEGGSVGGTGVTLKHTVTFINADGSVAKTIDVANGESVAEDDVPEPPEGYRWSGSYENIAKDIVVNAILVANPTINYASCGVFLDGNWIQVSNNNIVYNNGNNNNNRYYYVSRFSVNFAGNNSQINANWKWGSETKSITSSISARNNNRNYQLVGYSDGQDAYITPSSNTYYTVVFKRQGNIGSTINTQIVLSGSSIKLPDYTAPEGYTFDGWYLDSDTNKTIIPVGTNVAINSKTTYVAKLTRKSYSVNFYGLDGVKIGDSQTVYYGNSANAPTLINDYNGLRFDKWDEDYSSVKGNLDVHAIGYKLYKASFYDYDGRILDTRYYESKTGNEIQLVTPEEPTREGYDFAGWSNQEAIGSLVKSDLDIFATYTVKELTVNFFDGENTEAIETHTVLYGTNANCTTLPIGTLKDDKVLVGWNPAPLNITVDTDCVAIWEDAALHYDAVVTFQNESGAIIEKQYLNLGDTATQPATPAMPAGATEFLGWFNGDKEFDFATKVVGDITLVARFRDTWTVQFKVDNTVWKSIDVSNGARVTNPGAAPLPQVNQRFDAWLLGEDTYNFNAGVYADIVLQAEYTNLYYIYYETYSDPKMPTEVDEGNGATVPVDPEKAGYEFVRWSLTENGEDAYDFSAPLYSDITVHAVWVPTTADVTVIVWMEDENQTAASPEKYSYTYKTQYVIKGAKTEGVITVDKSNHKVKVDGSNALSLPVSNDESGYEYFELGWSDVDSKDITVKGDSSTVINVYYTRTYYTLKFFVETSQKNPTTWKVNGATITTTSDEYLVHEIKAKLGQSILANWPRNDSDNYKITRTSGNKFSCWSYGRGERQGSNVLSLTENFASIARNNDGVCNLTGVFESNLNTYYLMYMFEVLPYEDLPAKTKVYNGVTYALSTQYSQAAPTPGTYSQKDIYGYTPTGISTDGAEAFYKSYYNVNEIPSNYDVVEFLYYKRVRGYIELDLNGGTLKSTATGISDVNYVQGEESDIYRLPDVVSKNAGNVAYGASLSEYMPANPEKDGAKFIGWYTDAECMTEFNKSSATMPLGNLKLFAKWQEEPVIVDFLLTYTTSGEPYMEVSVSKNTPVSDIPDPENDPELGVFAGWYFFPFPEEMPNYTIPFVLGTTKVISDTKVYALWKTTGFKVTYDANGGTGSVVDTNEYALNVSARLKSGAGFTKENSTFIGWKIQGGDETIYQPSDRITINGDVTLIAQWVDQADVVAVTYKPNFTEEPVPGDIVLNYVKGANGNLLGESAFERAGYKIIGWTKTEGGTSAEYTTGAAHTFISEETFYAVWERVQVDYVVNYYYNYELGVGTSETEQAYIGDVITTYDAKPTYNNVEYAFVSATTPLTITAIAANNVINVYYVETLTIIGKKTWVGGTGADNTKVALTLTRGDGKTYINPTWNYETGEYSFAGLLKYASDKTEYTYTLSEAPITNYTTVYNGYDIKNISTETIDVEVTKEWIDPVGYTHPEVTLTLKRDGDVFRTHKLKATTVDTVKYTFSDLLKYNQTTGAPYVYTVTESKVSGYTSQETETGFKNTIEHVSIDISVTKVWEGPASDTHDSVTISLIRDGDTQNPISELILDSEHLTKSFTGLPKYAVGTIDDFDGPYDGHKFKYTVVEVMSEKDDLTYVLASITGDQDTGYTITNRKIVTSLTEEDATITKRWVDPVGTVHPSVGVKIYRTVAGNELNKEADYLKTVTVPAPSEEKPNESSFYVEGLVKYTDDYKLYEYSLEEEPVEGYTSSVDGFTITNRIKQKLINVTVNKEWVDPDGTTHGNIIIKLLQNGEEFGDPVKTVTLENGEKTYTFTGIETYDAKGQRYAYEVVEEAVEGYETTYGAVAIDENTGDMTFTVTNRIKQGTVAVSGTKTWNSPATEAKPTVKVELYRDAEETAIDTTELSAANTYSFGNLPKYAVGEIDSYEGEYDGHEFKYTVKEVMEGSAAENYESAVNGYNLVNTIKQAYIPEFTVEKRWQDPEGTKHGNITVQLMRDNEATPIAELTLSDEKLSDSFKNLPMYAVETDPEVVSNPSIIAYGGDKDGHAFVYKVVEVIADSEKGKYENPVYEAVITDGKITGYLITNTISQTMLSEDVVTIKKNWVDPDDIVHPDITVIINRNVKGSSDKEEVKRVVIEGTVSDTSTVFKEDWKLEAYSPDHQLYEYTLEELPVEGYTPSYDGFTITNTINQKLFDVAVTKNWVDPGDEEHDDITIVLLQNGEEYRNITLHNGETNYTFVDVPTYIEDGDDKGQKYVYTIEELEVEGYNSTISAPVINETTGDMSFTITNVIKQNKIDVTVVKNWIDPTGTVHPDITVWLVQNGTRIQSIVLSNGTESYTFEDVDEFNLDTGLRYIYSVEEEYLEGYTTDIDGLTITNTIEQQYIDIPVVKTWLEPVPMVHDTITIWLWQDNAPLYSANLANGETTYTFTEIPVFNLITGERYVYEITEGDVDGYTTEIDGFNVINTYEQKQLRGQLRVEWIDNSTDSASKPESVEIQLWRSVNGQTELVETLTLTGDFTYSWDTLDRYLIDNTGVYEYSYYVTEPNTPIAYELISENSTLIDDETVWDFTVINERKLMTIEGTKTWVNDTEDVRPASLTISLYEADGTEPIDTQVITGTTDVWSYRFPSENGSSGIGAIPMYPVNSNEPNEALKYVVYEDEGAPGLEDYTKEYDESHLNIINTYKNVITLRAIDKSYVYDGLPHGVNVTNIIVTSSGVYADFTVEGLPEGYELRNVELKSYPTAHDDPNDPTASINVVYGVPISFNDLTTYQIFYNGVDVTKYFTIVTIDAELDITPRPIVFRVIDAEKYYDGLPLYTTWTTDFNQLLPGHRAVAEITGDGKIEVGVYPVDFTMTDILDENGKSVKHNYEVIEVPGTIRIYIRDVTRTTYYTIHYFYDGVEDVDRMITRSGDVGDKITSYPNKPKTGMRFRYSEGLVLTLVEDSSRNVINVYYESYSEPTIIVDVDTPLAGSFMGATVGDCIE